ncbi:MAG: UDP-N-acetylmuramate--L-alanine ligase [Candidatus Omnitrophota bacterium]
MIELSHIKKIHFVGIGGSGMSGIAEVLHNMGFTVSGSDIGESDTVKRLKGKGIRVYLGHNKENVAHVETLVYSSAVTKENEEVKEALRRRIPVIPRAEMLAELMRMKFAVAVAGTHGKTTTTSMIASIFTSAGKDPTYVVGGRLQVEDSGAKLGKSIYLVAEADESDGSFLKLFPTIAVITNIEDDHLDYYKTMDNLRQAFTDFGNKVPFYGSVIANLECPETKTILPLFNKRVVTFSRYQKEANVRAEHIENALFKVGFDLVVDDQPSGRIDLNIGGMHNVSNALAAIAAALEIGIDIETIRDGLAKFYLPDRRFQVLFYTKDYLVVDDYAHHPTEIEAILNALKSGAFHRIIAVFQPHRFTRLELLMDRFATSFQAVDQLLLAPLYSANQQAIENISSTTLLKKMNETGFNRAMAMESLEAVNPYLRKEIRKGDAVIFLSAGNLTHTAHQFARLMEETIK